MIDPDTLPWSESAEQSVLGALMLDNSAWDTVADLLQTRMFFARKHALLYAAIGSMINANKGADVITVYDTLQAKGVGEEVGGLPYILAIAQSVPSAANARLHAGIVADHWSDRALRQTADECLTIAQGKGEPAIKLAAIVGRFDVLERKQVHQMPVGLDSIVAGVIDAINDMAERDAKPVCYSTGIPGIDKYLLGGLYPQRVYLLAGRPSVGKSALAHFIGLHAAEEGYVSLYLSQEVGKHEMGQRSLAMVGEISYERIQLGNLQGEEWTRLSEAAERCAKAPFHVDDQPSLRSLDIRIKARYIRGLKLLVLDYVQLCEGAEEGEPNRNAELEVISRGIKTLARTMDVAVIALSQLARRVEERKDKRAIMSDLKDCGGLEQDADVIMSLWPVPVPPRDGYVLIGCDLLKNRQGKKDVTVILEFHGHRMGWAESAYTVGDLMTKTAVESRPRKEL